MKIKEQHVWHNGIEYPNWEALVEAEANGYIATAVLRERAPKGTLFTFSVGPFATEREANNARRRMRNRHNREDRENRLASDLVTITVKPLWKKDE